MKFYETKIKPPQPETTYKKFLCRKCDLCGFETKHGDGEWSGGWYDINDTDIRVEIKQKEGTNYPEGGSGTNYEIDLCPNCFKEKLVPWLKSQGANIEEQEWDW